MRSMEERKKERYTKMKDEVNGRKKERKKERYTKMKDEVNGRKKERKKHNNER